MKAKELVVIKFRLTSKNLTVAADPFAFERDATARVKLLFSTTEVHSTLVFSLVEDDGELICIRVPSASDPFLSSTLWLVREKRWAKAIITVEEAMKFFNTTLI